MCIRDSCSFSCICLMSVCIDVRCFSRSTICSSFLSITLQLFTYKDSKRRCSWRMTWVWAFRFASSFVVVSRSDVYKRQPSLCHSSLPVGCWGDEEGSCCLCFTSCCGSVSYTHLQKECERVAWLKNRKWSLAVQETDSSFHSFCSGDRPEHIV